MIKIGIVFNKLGYGVPRFVLHNGKRKLSPWLASAINYSSINNEKDGKSIGRRLDHVPDIKKFLETQNKNEIDEKEIEDDILPPYMQHDMSKDRRKSVYFETYGCQMNVSDTELAWAILKKNGYNKVNEITKADVILLVTCAIREKAESKIWSRLKQLRKLKENEHSGYPKLGLLGCMAERLKKDVLEHEKAVDIIAGPDAYRDLPRLLSDCHENSTAAINVMLSVDETYADIMPVRFDDKSKTAFVSIMRGCDNMCSYCIVPFTRGRERSRPITSIVDEVQQLSDQGIKQVTVLGQNVNSYRDLSEQQFATHPTKMSKGFRTIYKTKQGGMRFADLLSRISDVDPNMRIRFTSPHPKDFPDEVLHLINERPNICKQIHLPAQSGSTNMLTAMRRGHTREDYLELVDRVRSIIPDVSISTDMISGFCGETEEDHQQTVDLVNQVKYDFGYFFAYSMRKKTHAYHRMQDDVPQEVKKRRLNEVMTAYKNHLPELRQREIGQTQLILIEGVSRKSSDEVYGRNDGHIKVVVPTKMSNREELQVGDYAVVEIVDYPTAGNTLVGKAIHKTTLTNFYNNSFQNLNSSSISSHLL